MVPTSLGKSQPSSTEPSDVSNLGQHFLQIPSPHASQGPRDNLLLQMKNQRT